MNRNPDEYSNIEQELVAMFERLVAEIPRDVAILKGNHTPDGHGTIVTLEPRIPAAASVHTHAENGFSLVDFSFGDYGPTWELPIEGRNSDANKVQVLKEVEEMTRAVMAGNCRHKRGLLSITGSLQAGDHPYKITDLLVFRPRPPRHGTRKYEPYN